MATTVATNVSASTTGVPHVVTGAAVRRSRTGVEWWEALGRVPMERILFDPPPGTATAADVVAIEARENRLCELIDGTLVEKTMGYVESLIAARLIYHLTAFVIANKLGLVSGPDGLLRLPGQRVRIPDVAFVARARLPDGRFPAGPVPELVPDLAVEVLSESNTRHELENKLREYFQVGVRLVWYLDPVTRSVEVFTSPLNVDRLGNNDVLTGNDVLPGFAVRVGDLFDVG